MKESFFVCTCVTLVRVVHAPATRNVGRVALACPLVMTLDEARSHIGSGVLYCTATAEAQYAEIARVFGSWVFVRCSSDDRTKPGRAEGSDAACRAGHRSRGKPD